MALQSMTGFARSQGQFEGVSWVWELRSVNAKGMDVRLRLPTGYEAIEVQARKLVQKHIKRGTVQISLSVIESSSNTIPHINREAVQSLIKAATVLQKEVGGELPTAAELMNIRGVVELIEKPLDEALKEKRDAMLLANLEEGTDALVETRTKEGVAIAKLLNQQVLKIEELHKAIEANDARSPAAIKAQLVLQVSKLIEASDKFDEERLHQEAAILAAKADLQEELDRLVVHVKAAKELLAGEGPLGRRLDFLAQEFNRECNTICSKSNFAEVTSLGLDMKLIIDQFREQLQNME